MHQLRPLLSPNADPSYCSTFLNHVFPPQRQYVCAGVWMFMDGHPESINTGNLARVLKEFSPEEVTSNVYTLVDVLLHNIQLQCQHGHSKQDLFLRASSGLTSLIWQQELLPFDILLLALIDRDDDQHALRLMQRKFMAPLMGRGIGNATGTEWQSQRRSANPAFHHQKIKMMISTMASSFAGMIKEWKKNIDMCGGSAEIEVYSQLAKTGAEIIARTGFGSECNHGKYASLQTKLQDLLFSRPLWCLIPGYRLGGFLIVPTGLSMGKL